MVSIADHDISETSRALNRHLQTNHNRNGSWINFPIPFVFSLSTLILIASSLSFHWAYLGAKKNDYTRLKTGLAVALGLGIAFLFTQWMGFSEIYDMGFQFVDNDEINGSKYKVQNVSGSFFFIIAGFHGVHIFAGLAILAVCLYKAIMFRIHAEKMLGLQLAAIFWHGMDVIWLILFAFLSSVYN